MNNKTKIKLIILVFMIMIILFSPVSLAILVKCLCGGCCVGCPGDCNTIGAPFAYYYWGTNVMSGEVVKQISVFGAIVDGIIIGFLAFFVYKLLYKI